MSSYVNFLGGQMSSYAIFRRGAHVWGGKCPTLHLSLRSLFCLFLSGCFTQVLQ